MFHRVEVVSVSGVLAAGEDEADLVAFEVDLNEGWLDQVGDGPKEVTPYHYFCYLYGNNGDNIVLCS